MAEMGNIHFVFRRGISSMNLVHVVVIKFLQSTYKEKQQDLHIVSVDLEKHYLVTRNLIWSTRPMIEIP